MKTEFDLLVYMALVGVIVVIGLGAWVIINTPDTTDQEARKVRFAAATFTGITMLFVFAACLYFAGGKDGPGREIFDKGLGAMFALAGSIVGYLFGSSGKSATDKKLSPGAGSVDKKD
jgi:cytochrome bd-type quinol oxidase subunit 2